MAFNPAAETARYIDSLGPEALQKAADYTTATHWMLLGGLVVTAIVTWILVRSGFLERLSTKLQNRGWALRTFLVCMAFFLLSALISLPWGIYEEWGFEKSYGRTSQPFADFIAQNVIGIALALGIAIDLIVIIGDELCHWTSSFNLVMRNWESIKSRSGF